MKKIYTALNGTIGNLSKSSIMAINVVLFYTLVVLTGIDSIISVFTVSILGIIYNAGVLITLYMINPITSKNLTTNKSLAYKYATIISGLLLVSFGYSLITGIIGFKVIPVIIHVIIMIPLIAYFTVLLKKEK